MIIRQATLDDLSEIFMIENRNFNENERIEISVIKEYLEKTPETIFLIEDNDQVVAYCISVLSAEKVVTDQLFYNYFPCLDNKGYLIVLSLSIHPSYQKQGLGTMLLATLKDYCFHQSYFGIALTCHNYLIPYYEMNGFKEMGISQSTFGQEVWFDMLLEMII